MKRREKKSFPNALNLRAGKNKESGSIVTNKNKNYKHPEIWNYFLSDDKREFLIARTDNKKIIARVPNTKPDAISVAKLITAAPALYRGINLALLTLMTIGADGNETVNALDVLIRNIYEA